MTVKKTIFGMEALPRFCGGCEPAYWVAIVKNRILTRTFQSPHELFRYVEDYYAAHFLKAG